MKRPRILSFFNFALLGALLCLSLTSCTRVAAKANPTATEAVPVRAARAVLEDVPLEIAAVGNVEAMDRVQVKSRVAGQINRVAFAEGQNVTRGQLLFSIDRETLERQALEQQANLERDAAMEQQARAVVARDAAAEKQSQSEADVARQLGTLGVISGQRVNQLVTTSDTSQAALHADQAAVEAAAGTTRADRARLAETQLQMRFTDVVAPIGGRAGAGDGERRQHGARQRHNAGYCAAIGAYLRHLRDSRTESARSAAPQCCGPAGGERQALTERTAAD